MLASAEKMIPVQIDYQRELVLQFSRVVRSVVMSTFLAAQRKATTTEAKQRRRQTLVLGVVLEEASALAHPELSLLLSARRLGVPEDRRVDHHASQPARLFECDHRQTREELLGAQRPGAAADEQTASMVERAVEELDEDLRQVIVLRHWLDQSYDEMAETLGIPAKTVKSRLFTARQRLAKVLQKRGVRAT